MKLRVEYRYDPESKNWCFTVPSLGIVGGAETRPQAEQEALDAIAFTLEDGNGEPEPPSAEVSYLQVTVQRP